MKTWLVVILFMTGCAAKNSGDPSVAVDPIEASVEAGVTAADGTIDDQNGSVYALRSPVRASFLDLLEERASAASCVRAVGMACSAGVRQTSYNDCSGVNSSRDFNGSVTLTYSQAACTLSSNGDTVTRTYSVQISGPRGGVVSNSSSAHTNYLGSSIGGGGQITKTAGGYSLAILGRNSSLSYNSRTLYDISVHTSSPVSVLGSLSRSSRTLDGGAIVVDHNLAGFTATFAPSNLGYSASCCHPVSGSMSVTFAGSKTGSGTITFNSCGSATVNYNGSTSDIALSYCE